MNKDSKSIFKMQEAGSIPEVNQYGLTEEQMQSVRDNMRRYGLSEEDAVSNKKLAQMHSRQMTNSIMSNLDGPIGEAYERAKDSFSLNDKIRLLDKTNALINSNNVRPNFSRSLGFDPYWKVNQRWNLDRLKNNVANTARESRDFAHMVVGYKGPFSSYSPDALRIAESIKRGNYRNNKDYEKYVQEYLDQNPRKYNFFADNYHTMSPNSDATTDRVQAAHDYAIAKLKEQWDHDKEIANLSNYNYQRHLENSYHPDYEKYNPRNQWTDALKKSAAVGGSTMLTLSMLPWLGSEVATYGLLGAVPRIAGGFIGSELGMKGAGYIGKQADRVLGTKWIEPVSKFTGMLAGWRKGEGLGYTGALKGTRFGMRTIANNMMRNGAYDITFQPKRWLLGNQTQADLKLMNMGWDPIKNPINLYNIAGAYRRANPSTMIMAPAYRDGGILKKQTGGLVYKPFFPEEYVQPQDVETISYEPDGINDEPFQVEPVRIYSQRVARKPIISEEESATQEIETPVDNTRVEKPASEGKIYKSEEKEQFKEDLYNAYLKALNENLEALKKKGMKESDIEEFAKKLATQDILESNWSQSSLSKNFNFGGIKDFSGKGAVKDTTEVINGKSVKIKQSFRKFEDLDEYVNYKINLVDRKWDVFNSDPDKYYSVIVSGQQKYATDPNYTSKLNNLYKQIWK